MKAKLINDVPSLFKKGTFYGRAGEEVTIIKEGEIVIVENIKGNRYHTKEINLKRI